MQKPAAPLKPHGRHCACVHAVVCGMKLADPSITAEPSGVTASQSRTADIFTTAAVPGRVCSLSQCSPSMCAWPPPLQRQLAEMLHRGHSIVSWRTKGMKWENLDNRTHTTARKSGQRTANRTQLSLEHFSTQQISPPVATDSISWRSPCIADGCKKSKSLSCRGG